jgi:pyruvate formate lyase activating enzyme
MYDTCEKARALGLKNVMVSSGYINQRPLADLCRVIDAIKIDFKAFSDSFYKDICRGRLQPVLDAMVTIRKLGLWMEMVYLVIPTLNDSPKEMRDLCRWVVKELGPDVPLHFSRFYPTYLLNNLPPTPVDTLETFHTIAVSEGIHHAYIGNVPGHPMESTYCHKCSTRIIQRSGYNVKIERLEKGTCGKCGTTIPGIWG